MLDCIGFFECIQKNQKTDLFKKIRVINRLIENEVIYM